MSKAKRVRAAHAAEPVKAEALKLDFGCGPHKRAGFMGVDATAFPGVDYVHDLRVAPWPWLDGTVAEAHASHFVEHLTSEERVLFCNELYRVLAPGAACQVIVPHWASCRAYGDPTHRWPPVSEFWFYYLSREWRAANAPHTDIAHNPLGFSCNFVAVWGYSIHPMIATRSAEQQQFAIANYKEACQDISATLTKA